MSIEHLTRNFCIRQFTLTRESIDLVQLLLDECKTHLQITVAVYLDGDWQSLRVLQLGETVRPLIQKELENCTVAL